MQPQQISDVNRLQLEANKYSTIATRIAATAVISISLNDAETGFSIDGGIPLIRPAGEPATPIESACADFIAALLEIFNDKAATANNQLHDYNCANPTT